jgi:hypothetical protein
LGLIIVITRFGLQLSGFFEAYYCNQTPGLQLSGLLGLIIVIEHLEGVSQIKPSEKREGADAAVTPMIPF